MDKVQGKRYIIWDFDGTIINSEPIHYRSFSKTMNTLCGEIPEIGWEAYKKCIGKKYPYFADVLQPYVPYDLHRPEFHELFDKNNELLMDEDCPPVNGVIETIITLYERGYQMAVASSSSYRYITKYLSKLGLMDYFDEIVAGEMVENSKPAPDIFLKAAQKLGGTIDKCVVVEDSNNGVIAGHASGMFTVGFQNPDSGDQDLSMSSVIINQMTELIDLLA